MKTRTVCKTHVLAACFLTALLVGAFGTVKAQGWPPTPAQGNDPYHSGTFTYNGRTYTISYVSTNGSSGGNGPALATFSLSGAGSVSFLNASRSGNQTIGTTGEVALDQPDPSQTP